MGEMMNEIDRWTTASSNCLGYDPDNGSLVKYEDHCVALDALRAQLTEKDREIERLKAERDLATHKCITCGVAAENPEIASKGVYVEKWDSPQAQAVRKVVAQLSASQAREREAVERAERAEHNWHWVFETLGIPKEADGSLDLDKAQPVLSALAASRKALEEIAQAPGDNIGVWCRDIARAALNGDSHE